MSGHLTSSCCIEDGIEPCGPFTDMQIAYEEVLADKRRLAREIDVALHGEDGAAKQASLCDLIEPVRQLRDALTAAQAERRVIEDERDQAYEQIAAHLESAAYFEQQAILERENAAQARERALVEVLTPFSVDDPAWQDEPDSLAVSLQAFDEGQCPYVLLGDLRRARSALAAIKASQGDVP